MPPEVRNIVLFVGPADALERVVSDARASLPAIAPPDQTTIEGDPGDGEVFFRFVTVEAPAETWLELLGRGHPTVTLTLIYQALDHSFAGRTVWEKGELAAYDWFDPALDYDMPDDLVEPIDLRAGAVNLDDEETYAEPIEFVLQMLDEMAEALPDAGNAVAWVYLDLADPGDYEQLDEWTPYFGPMTDWGVVDLSGEQLFAWVEEMLRRAFKYAAENGPDRRTDFEAETTVVVHVYPASAEGWFRATS